MSERFEDFIRSNQTVNDLCIEIDGLKKINKIYCEQLEAAKKIINESYDKETVLKIIHTLIERDTHCHICETLGQLPVKCNCSNPKDCSKHYLELWENKYKGE